MNYLTLFVLFRYFRLFITLLSLMSLTPVQAFLTSTETNAAEGVSVKLENISRFWYLAPPSGALLLNITIRNLTEKNLSGEARLVFLAIGGKLDFDALHIEPVICDNEPENCSVQKGFFTENQSIKPGEEKQISLFVTLPLVYCQNSIPLQVALLFRGQDDEQKPYSAKDVFFLKPSVHLYEK
jgi:hypothetical protein